MYIYIYIYIYICTPIVLRCVAVCCGVLRCVAVCCSVFAVCCSVLLLHVPRHIQVHQCLSFWVTCDFPGNLLIVKRTATPCNALQRTATYCNTLLMVKRTATHSNAVQHTTTHYNTLQHTAPHCNTLRSIGLTWEWSDWIIWEIAEGKGSRSSNRIRNTTRDMLVITARLIVLLSFLETSCNLLQHTATLQHTLSKQKLSAIYCNTLQHTVTGKTSSNLLQDTATHRHSLAVVFRN